METQKEENNDRVKKGQRWGLRIAPPWGKQPSIHNASQVSWQQPEPSNRILATATNCPLFVYWPIRAMWIKFEAPNHKPRCFNKSRVGVLLHTALLGSTQKKYKHKQEIMVSKAVRGLNQCKSRNTHTSNTGWLGRPHLEGGAFTPPHTRPHTPTHPRTRTPVLPITNTPISYSLFNTEH